MMILIAGPYRSGTGDDTVRMAANVRAMEAYALPLFRAGHVPIVGEWLALPLVALAGSRAVGDEAFNEIFHPIAERLLQRCDAVLRVGGASQGADLMVSLAKERALPVFHALREGPGCETMAEPVAQPPPPIACRMDALSPEQRVRRGEVVDLIRTRLSGLSETEDGILFQWASDEHLPALIGEFIALESRCCPFIRFTMDVEAERGAISLRLGGREGVKEFLRVTFSQVSSTDAHLR